MNFRWDEVQRRPDGKVLLLYRHERILEEGHARPGVKVLDVGGWGVLAQRLIEEGCDCTVLDLFTADQAYPERVRALPHKAGDVCDQGCFLPETFDLVTCFETLEHVADLDAALGNIRRWLRKGGVLVGTVPLPGRIHAGDPAVRVPEPEDLREALRDAGFSAVVVEPSPSIDRGDEPVCTYFTAVKRR